MFPLPLGRCFSLDPYIRCPLEGRDRLGLLPHWYVGLLVQFRYLTEYIS